MADPKSSFRKLLENAECYPELPFVVNVSAGSGELFNSLKPLADLDGEERIEVSGKIDLALRYRDGTWCILDYKTDRMLPIDGGNPQAFHERLNREYGAQLDTYRFILESITGEPVVDTVLISV